MADSGNLTPRQRRAIAALLAEKNILEAAKKAGVGERTLHRWLDGDSGFQAELKAAERSAIDAAIRRLADLTGEAVSTLREVMGDKTASAGSRVQAASVALARFGELKELSELEARITSIEQSLKGGDK
jgi:hypothetical protein